LPNKFSSPRSKGHAGFPFHSPSDYRAATLVAINEMSAHSNKTAVANGDAKKADALAGRLKAAAEILEMDVRSVLLRYLRELECEAEVVVARKIPALFEKQHHGREEEFYADLLAHLIKNRLKRAGTLVLNVAERGSSTRKKVLTEALQLATERAARKWGGENLKARVVFNVQNPRTEPLLTVSDYLCWAVQRVFEQGEVRHYNYLADKIRLVVDLYDREKYEGSRNYYDKKNPLTAENKLGPPVT
jgi:hypothetical protein